ncbi:MAG TPA: cytochrome c biogenesis protein DipZ [Reyranella sp.]|jgi:cytochrome c biogenesis protein CcdA/thiol-disulfide isomerase/thioredoxin|nr:cytochrome c biogenesis protein DipZ [Reyranella sp.]
MILFVLSYVGGVLTIISPCILPVLPFVFARADQPFVKSGLPMLLGMAATFALVATLAAVGGGWAVQANEYGRTIAIVVLAVLGVTLLFPSLADRLTRPLVAVGARLSASADSGGHSQTILPSFLLGIATGLLWAPCAGPILGLILTGAALNGANAQTSLLLLAYAAGAATSLAVALLIGGRVFAAMKRSLGVSEWIRRGLGVAVLVGVAAIALGLDTGVLTQASLASTAGLEQGLLDKFGKEARPPGEQGSMAMAAKPPADPTGPLSVEGGLPALDGAVEWLNSPPLTKQGLRGKVVLIDFWTYSCINCLRAIPYVRAWAQKYKDQGLVVIGIHTPEFAFERNADNVKRAVRDLKIDYPVAIDSNFALWRAFDNQYWPAHYFIDAEGRIRHHHFGEGQYAESERVIQQLLAETGKTDIAKGVVAVTAAGAEAAADAGNVKSPETYIGFMRAENFSSPGGTVQDVDHVYALPTDLRLNQWALKGTWKIEDERAILGAAGGGIAFRFHARDLHLVLGAGDDGKPVRFGVLLDGQRPGDDHGADIDANGEGTVTGQRLYQLVRQRGPVKERTFEIQFLDPGVQAFAFTFG